VAEEDSQKLIKLITEMIAAQSEQRRPRGSTAHRRSSTVS